MDEQPNTTETELPTMINDDEFVENGNNVVGEEDGDEDEAKVVSSPTHDKWIWLHAAFHCLVQWS
jgi:hypothetical protein